MKRILRIYRILLTRVTMLMYHSWKKLFIQNKNMFRRKDRPIKRTVREMELLFPIHLPVEILVVGLHLAVLLRSDRFQIIMNNKIRYWVPSPSQILVKIKKSHKLKKRRLILVHNLIQGKCSILCFQAIIMTRQNKKVWH